jgi:hypothetical protein
VTLLIEAAKAIGGPGSIGFFVFCSMLALVAGRWGGWRHPDDPRVRWR